MPTFQPQATPYGTTFDALTEQSKLRMETRTTVTIGQVLEWYRTKDGIVQASALREIIDSTVQCNRPIQVENDSYFDALVISEIMFDRANKSIRLFTGRNCVEFLRALQRSFFNALKRLAHSGGKVQVLMVSNEVPSFFSDLKSQYPNTLEVALAKIREGAEVGHFFVCDSQMARIEQPHPPLTLATPVNAIRAKIYFNDPVSGRLLDARFGAYWNAASVTEQRPLKTGE